MTDPKEVKLHFLDYWRVIKLRLGLILLTFFLVIVTAGVYVFFLPKQYRSQVTVEIKPDALNKGTGVNDNSSAGRLDPQFLQTQFQVIKTSEILIPVIEQLDLIKKFSPRGTTMPMQWVIENLSHSINVQGGRNTALVEISVYNVDKDLAAQIANTIATTYRDKRIKSLSSNTDQTLAEMKDELKLKEEELKALFQEASKIRQQDGIVDTDPESLNGIVSISADRDLPGLETQIVEKRAIVDQLRNQLKSVEEMRPEQLKEALRIIKIVDQTAEKTIPLLQDANAEEARLLSSGLGDNHPRVKALRAQREVYSKTLDDALSGIKRSLKTNLEIEETTLKTFEQTMSSRRKDQINEKTRTATYTEKKSAYLASKQLLQSIRMRYDAARFDTKISQTPVEIWERAVPGLFPEKPRVVIWMILAALCGIIAGVGIAFFIEYLDTSVKTVDDIERHLDLPVLAVIPTEISVLLKQKRDTADAEAYRILKSNIELHLSEPGANTYTLVSGGPGEGKSTTLTNLAYTYAKGGASVLVVDADLRRPSQHKFFDLDNSVGLVDYLHGRNTIQEITKSSRLENLSIIPSGSLSNEDVGILNGPRMSELIAQLKRQYDIVFFDSPPILGVSDASILVSEVENTIMVVQYRRFPRNMLQRVKSTVVHVGGNLIGVVLNNVDIRQDDSYRYYSNYKDYYSPKNIDSQRPKALPAATTSDDEDAY